MKKTICLILCLALMLTLIPLGMIGASAASVRITLDYRCVLPGDIGTHYDYASTDADGMLAEPSPDFENGDLIFYGWYLDEAYTKPVDFSKPFPAAITIYARWVSGDECSLVWWYLSATDAEPLTGAYVVNGECFDPPEAPGGDGVFVGWYPDRELTQRYDAAKPITRTISIFPRFADESEVCTVTRYNDLFDTEPAGTDYVVRGERYPEPKTPDSAQSFLGWYTDRGTLTNRFYPTRPVTGDIELFPVFQISYTVNLYRDPDDPDPYYSSPVLRGRTYTVTQNPAAYSGSTFEGWYLDKSFTQPYEPVAPREDMNLYAKFSYPMPKITAFSNGAGGVNITWTNVGAKHYRVFRKKPTEKSWTALGITEATFSSVDNSVYGYNGGNTFVDSTAESGTTYLYTVRVMNENKTRYLSTYYTAGWKFTVVAMPVITSLIPTKAGMQITWSKSEGAYAYRVFQKVYPGWKAVGTTTGTTLVDKNVEAGSNYANVYTYTVRALDKNGKYITDYDREGKTQAYILTPMINSFQNTASGAKMTWGAYPGAAKYRVFVKSGSSWKKLGDTASTSFIHKAAVSGTTYTYTVRAIGSNGSYLTGYFARGWDNKFIATPAIPGAKAYGSGVKIAVTLPKGAVKYAVFRREYGTTKWVRVGVYKSSTTILYDYKVSANTYYYYTVRCVDSDGSYVSDYNRTGRLVKTQ